MTGFASEHAFVALSIVLLGVGPILAHFSRHARAALAAVDSFALVTVGGLVLLHVLPQAILEGGWPALAVALVGLAGPFSMERLGGRVSRAGHHLIVAVVAFGFIPHALLDGVALSIGTSDGGDGGHASSFLPFAVVLHRLPVGFAIWWVVRPNQGRNRAVLVLGLIALATLTGFALGRPYLHAFEETGFVFIQALVSGALLHVIMHAPHGMESPGTPSRWKLAEVAGAAAGVAFFWFLPGQHGHTEGLRDFGARYGETFLELALESAPALLLGYLTAGVLAALPRSSLSWLRRGGSWRQSFMGTAYGFPLPICSCGVVPIYRSLILRGVPATAAMAFMVATPELGVESLLLSVPLLGMKLTLLRIACALAVALAIGRYVGRLVAPPSAPPPAEEERPVKIGWRARLRRVFTVGFGEILDETAPWILVGLAVAAAIAPSGIEEYLARIPAGLDVVLFALAGIPIYICASGATPLAAVLVAQGLSPGAAIALLLTGPATNITTYGVLSRLHGRKVAVQFMLGVMGLSIALGYGVNLVLHGTYRVPEIHRDVEETNPLLWASLAALACAFLLSILRLGPRRFIAMLLAYDHPDTPVGGPEGDPCAAAGHDHRHG